MTFLLICHPESEISSVQDDMSARSRKRLKRDCFLHMAACFFTEKSRMESSGTLFVVKTVFCP